ncbi:MAG TPA: hypothetical protein VEA15_11175, partial [Caulobacteraceae bacterium]|nr:hypothetical protein [Caulobacteraceae bacterium]
LGWGGEDDRFFGGEGDDELRSGYGADVDWMQGGLGDDIIDGGGIGSDFAVYDDATGSLHIDLRIQGVAQDVGGGLGKDTLIEIDNLWCGAFADTLLGNDGFNYLHGGEGDDLLTGFLGLDMYGVGQGADVVTDFYDQTMDVDYHQGEEFRVEGHTQYQSVQQVGADVLVTFGGGDTLLIRNISASLIGYADFSFSQTGGAGNDVLTGGAYRDYITGGDGADVIYGGSGGNTLDGGDGFDWIDYSGSQLAIWVTVAAMAETGGSTGGEGQPGTYDSLRNFEAVRGSAFNDTIYGDEHANFLEGGKGDDWIDGHMGDDTWVFGTGDGHDTFVHFTGGGTEDRIQVKGYTGYQSIQQVGADTLITFSATDSVLLVDVQASSVTADDFVWGQAFARLNEMGGTEGGETVVGTEGSDRIDAWSGNDVVDGRGGADFLYGGYGDDRLTGGAGNDLLDGGDGTDTADYSATAQAISVNLSLVSAQGTGGSGVDTLLSIENLFGGLGGDTLTGNAAANDIRGGEGADVIAGAGGNDYLTGGAGNDVFVFAQGGGHDTIWDFNAGSDDRINVSGFGGYTLRQAGGDTLVVFDDNHSILLKFVQASTLTSADFNITAAPNQITGTGAGEALDGTSAGDRIEGLGGDDSLRGMGGDDTVLGGEGDDLLDGGVGDDTLDGGAGVDTADYHTFASAVTVSLALAGAQNTVGAGTDTLAGIENLIGGFGDDQLTGDGDANRLTGGAGADRLDGGAGDDLLTGGAGADALIGGSGYDRASYAAAAAAISINLTTGAHTGEAMGDAFSGVEQVVLSAHGDTFTGSASGDGADGGAGSDSLMGAGGDDVLSGGDGNDRLVGGAGNDALDGGAGTDQADYRNATAGVTVSLAAGTATGEGSDTLSGVENVQGSAHADSLTGEAGANSLNGHGGADTLNGAEGNDILVGGAGADVLNGGAGLDYASYISATAGVGINLLSGTHTGDAAGDTFTSVERFRLSAQTDSFQGNALTNYAYGAEGNDALRGGAGFDRLYGEEGADQLFGEADNDVLIGGAGADAIDGGGGKDGASYETATAAVGVNLQSLSHTGDATGDTFTSVEFFILSGHADSFTGGSAGDEAQGGAGNDTLMGNGGADWLRGQDGADVLLGGVGEDILEGGAGADQLNGGDGIDYASYLKAVGLNLSTGVHTGEAAGDSFTSVERFRLSGYDDSFFGSAGDDWVAGYAGNDTLNGGDGNDTLNGGFSSDVLIGGAGNDKLIGELGNDTLTGGAGSDAFQVTAAGFGNDVVTDFGAGDYIRVTGIAGVNDISDLAISQNGANTLITFPDGSTITLNGVSAVSLDEADFSFG